MGRKALVLLAVLLLVLGGVAGFIYKGGNSDWKQADTQAGAKVLGGITINDIAAIHIKSAKDELNLERTGGVWGIKQRAGYPADAQKIGPLLVKLSELKVTQTEAISEALRPRLQLAAPGATGGSTEGGTALELLDAKGKPLGSLILGKAITRKSDIPGATRDVPTGRYLLKPEAPATAIAINDPLTEIDASPAAWLDKTFIKPDRVKSITFSSDGKPRWTMQRNEEAEMAWQLKDAAKGEDFDTGKAQDEARGLAGIGMVDLAMNTKPDDLAGGDVLAFDTFDGLSYTLTLGKKDGENRPVLMGVSGKLTPAPERTPGKDEKPEDKAKLDKEYKDKAAANEARAAHELAMDKKVFLVADASIVPLVKDRATLMKAKQSTAQPDVPGLQQFEKKAPSKAAEKAPAKK
jgi:hypothetical protein